MTEHPNIPFNMKKIISIILIGILIFSCSKEENNADQIVGNWKLIEAKIYGFEGLNTIDYSDDTIYYNFQTNRTLIVTGGENVGYPIGAYDYFFGEDHLGGMNDPKIILVKINDTKWTYNLANEKMTLGLSYVDGPDLVFERK